MYACNIAELVSSRNVSVCFIKSSELFYIDTYFISATPPDCFSDLVDLSLESLCKVHLPFPAPRYSNSVQPSAGPGGGAGGGASVLLQVPCVILMCCPGLQTVAPNTWPGFWHRHKCLPSQHLILPLCLCVVFRVAQKVGGERDYL